MEMMFSGPGVSTSVGSAVRLDHLEGLSQSKSFYDSVTEFPQHQGPTEQDVPASPWWEKDQPLKFRG